MPDLNMQQEKEIGAMQSDIRHISLAVERIENMILSHNKVHEEMSRRFDDRMKLTEKKVDAQGSWITFVKWGAGALTTAIFFFAPNLARILNDRPTEQQVVAIIKEELQGVVASESKDK